MNHSLKLFDGLSKKGKPIEVTANILSKPPSCATELHYPVFQGSYKPNVQLIEQPESITSDDLDTIMCYSLHYLSMITFKSRSSVTLMWGGLKFLESQSNPSSDINYYKINRSFFKEYNLKDFESSSLMKLSDAQHYQMAYFLCIFRVLSSSEASADMISTRCVSYLQSQFKSASSAFAPSRASMGNKVDFSKIACILDRLFILFHESDISHMRFGTVTVFHKDNSTLQRLFTLSAKDESLSGISMFFAIKARIKDNYDSIIKYCNQKSCEEVIPYMSAMEEVSRSLFSSVAMNSTFVYLSVLCSRLVNNKLYNTYLSSVTGYRSEIILGFLVSQYAAEAESYKTDVQFKIIEDNYPELEASDEEEDEAQLSRAVFLTNLRLMVTHRLMTTLSITREECTIFKSDIDKNNIRPYSLGAAIMSLVGEDDPDYLDNWIKLAGNKLKMSNREIFSKEWASLLTLNSPLLDFSKENTDYNQDIKDQLSDMISNN